MRVLAVTGNTSLVVALSSMMRDWDVVTIGSIAQVTDSAADSAIVLIDLGATDEGLEAAAQLHSRGVDTPSVVIGDVAVEDPRALVLVRPFSLEDLSEAVRRASERKPASIESSAESIAFKDPNRSVPAPRSQERTPPGERAAARGGAAGSPLPEAEAESQRGGLSVVRAEAHEADVELEPTEGPSREVAEEVSSPEPVDPAAASEPAPEQERRAEPARGVATSGRRRFQRRAALAQSRDVDEGAEAESPLMRRLRSAATLLGGLEALLQDLPILGDLRSITDALAEEIEMEFKAPVVSVFVPEADGYHVVANRGLSRVEAGMVVAETQPLFSDVLQTREGILIQPVDLAQGLVAGIGGARTESLMAAPALLDGACVAIVVVGSDHFEERDLDRLSDLAEEAAPGVEVARLLHRLRHPIGD